MFTKQSFIAVCLFGMVLAEPHVLAPAAPAFVTAQSSQVFARTYNGFVPVHAVAAPAPIPAPAPTFYVPQPVVYPQQFVYTSHTAIPAAIPAPLPAAIPATPAVPAVIAAAPAPVAKLVAAAPVAKVARLVRPAPPYLTTIRYRSIVA